MDKWRPLKGFEGYYWVSDDYRIKNSRNKVLKPIRATIKGNKLSLVYRLHSVGQNKTVNQPQVTRVQFKADERAEWVNPLIVTGLEEICPICKSEEIYTKRVNSMSYLVCQNCGERFGTIKIEEE